MRGAPQVGFSPIIRKIKLRSPLLTRFRPLFRLTRATHDPPEEMPQRHDHGKKRKLRITVPTSKWDLGCHLCQRPLIRRCIIYARFVSEEGYKP